MSRVAVWPQAQNESLPAGLIAGIDSEHIVNINYRKEH
jgi:hypothetical protein